MIAQVYASRRARHNSSSRIHIRGKYTCFDWYATAISILLNCFQARLEVGKQGSGAVVFAYAYLTNSQTHSSNILLQDLIWRRHKGPIPERKRVVHRNHISMDNRLDNLCMIDINDTHVWYTSANMAKPNDNVSITNNSPSSAESLPSTSSKSTSNDLHLTLYWAAIQQLPPEHIQQNEVRV